MICNLHMTYGSLNLSFCISKVKLNVNILSWINKSNNKVQLEITRPLLWRMFLIKLNVCNYRDCELSSNYPERPFFLSCTLILDILFVCDMQGFFCRTWPFEKLCNYAIRPNECTPLRYTRCTYTEEKEMVPGQNTPPTKSPSVKIPYKQYISCQKDFYTTINSIIVLIWLKIQN